MIIDQRMMKIGFASDDTASWVYQIVLKGNFVEKN